MRPSLLALTTSAVLIAAPARAQTAKTVDPDEADPKLPAAGKPISVQLPQKKEGASLLWKPRWQKFSGTEYVITSVSIAVTVGSLFIPPRPSAWNSGGILFDEGARSALRPDSPGWRYNIRDASDVLLSISSTYPFLVDSLIVAWWHRGSSTVATQMALMNAEAMAIAAAIQGITSGFGSRERPYGRDCSLEPDVDDCRKTNRYRSFFSGHTSQAFVSAALTCAHHDNIPLYGARSADLAAHVRSMRAPTRTIASRSNLARAPRRGTTPGTASCCCRCRSGMARRSDCSARIA